MKKECKLIISIILSLVTILFICHNYSINGNSVVLIMLFPVFIIFFKKTLANIEKRKDSISVILAILFTIIEIIGSSINKDFTLNNIVNKFTILNMVGYIILFWSVISNIYVFIDYLNRNEYIEKNKFKILSGNKKWFVICFALIFVAWLPYFLRYYPGLLTADSCAQVAQAIGKATLTNHHPIFHTGIISFWINIGINILGNINKGVALYTVSQIVAMAIVFAIIIYYLSVKKIPLYIRIIFLLYYMFYPIHALFSVTMWKDILFAGIIPLYVICTYELVINTNDYLNKKLNILYYCLTSILVMYLRNNGVYIVLIMMPILLVVLRRNWKKIGLIFLTILVLFFGTRTIIFNLFNIKSGSVGEMLSIPLQQIARVKKYHKAELDNETIQEINNYFKCNNIEEKYNPVLSDPVKAELNENYFNENKIDFIKLWLKLLKCYFKDYVESFISNSYGYYYPEATHWVANRTMEVNEMGIEQSPKIQGRIVTWLNSFIERRDIPLISMFFSIGMAFWITTISFGYEIINKRYKNISAYMIIFLLWLTIIASPVFCEYRYAYPMFTTLPIYLGINFIKKESI